MPSTHGEGKPYGRAVASQSLAESIICPSPCLHERQGLEFSHRSSYGSELLESEDRCTLAVVCPGPSSCRLARMWGGGDGWRRHSPSPSCHSQSLPPVLRGAVFEPRGRGEEAGNRPRHASWPAQHGLAPETRVRPWASANTLFFRCDSTLPLIPALRDENWVFNWILHIIAVKLRSISGLRGFMLAFILLVRLCMDYNSPKLIIC